MKKIYFCFLGLLIIALAGCSNSKNFSEQIRIEGGAVNTQNNNYITSDECKEFGGEVAGFICPKNEIDLGVVLDVKGSDRHCCGAK